MQAKLTTACVQLLSIPSAEERTPIPAERFNSRSLYGELHGDKEQTSASGRRPPSLSVHLRSLPSP